MRTSSCPDAVVQECCWPVCVAGVLMDFACVWWVSTGFDTTQSVTRRSGKVVRSRHSVLLAVTDARGNDRGAPAAVQQPAAEPPGAVQRRRRRPPPRHHGASAGGSLLQLCQHTRTSAQPSLLRRLNAHPMCAGCRPLLAECIGNAAKLLFGMVFKHRYSLASAVC